MFRLTLVLPLVIGFAGCAHRTTEPADDNGYRLYIEEHPRPLLSEAAWNQISVGMTKDEVMKLLGPPDEGEGPITITGPSEMILDRDGKKERIMTKPTTRVIGESQWKYLRPTSQSPEMTYTISFDGDSVDRFWSVRIHPATKP